MEQTEHKKGKRWIKILAVFLICGAVIGGIAIYHFSHSDAYEDYEMNEYIRLPDYQALIEEALTGETQTGEEQTDETQTGETLTDGEQAEAGLTDEQKEQLWQEIIAESEVIRYPSKEKTACRERAEAYYLTLAEGYGYTEENFTEFLEEIYSWTEEDYEEALELYTENLMKEELAVYAVAQQEGLTVSDGEYENHLKEILKNAGYDKDGFQEIFGMTVEEYAEENNIRTELLKEKIFAEIFK